MQLPGWYQYPGRAAREAARLTLAERHLTLTHDGHQQILLVSEIIVSDALGSIPLTVTFPDGGRFVPQDDALFRHWWQQRHRPGLIHRLERHRRSVALTLLAALGIVALYIWIVLPAVSNTLAMHIPAWAEQQVGQQTLTLLQNSGFGEARSGTQQQARAQRVFNAVVPAAMQRDATPPRLKLMHFPGGPNALMLADGTLIVSDELVTLARSDDALAAVMLHELGHHRYRHPMRMLVRSSLVTLSYMWLTGDVSGIGDTLLQSAAFINQMQFSRQMEREADNYAIAQMHAQRRPLAAMAEIYRQLQQAGEKQEGEIKLPEWMSTHPDMQQRIEAVEAAR